MNINEYFVSGGESDSDEQYGLYFPNDDAIVMVHDNLEYIKKLSFLFSSRYKFVIIKLSKLKDDIRISNLNINSWTINKKEIYSLTRFDSFETIYNIDKIIPNTNYNGFVDLPYLFVALHYIKFLNKIKLDRFTVYKQYSTVFPFEDEFKILENKIYNTIYLTCDVQDAITELKEIEHEFA